MPNTILEEIFNLTNHAGRSELAPERSVDGSAAQERLVDNLVIDGVFGVKAVRAAASPELKVWTQASTMSRGRIKLIYAPGGPSPEKENAA